MHIKLEKKISSLYYFITPTKIARIATKHNNDKKKINRPPEVYKR